MKRPQDEVPLRPEEGAALIERLTRNTLRADDRRLLVQVVRWLFWLLGVVQEAKLSRKRLRALVFGKPSLPPQEKAPRSSRCGARRMGAEVQSPLRRVPRRHTQRRGATPTLAGKRDAVGGIAAAKGVMAPRRMREPSVLRVGMRHGGWARSVRYAARAISVPYRPG